ncbi:MAG TPA: cell division protein FtsL [Thermoclostridium caenicola]|uniref:Cell division protein FtsL n=1 Tax=Thermoclostridium caenicola TaxID=659425 RepID=A0A1M6FB88_9FIRM|nr:cell division protein FtsL [Thermoclostridium caenicola]SHI94942.1 cell division protein FtsL [Thermoclostridium caenicola]HOK42511.1 cell division protein FtsL [Thermoclostridium caenicola]HOL84831.1 cell division protein FtsL [Thermoclostridium caenicola]HOP72474.1 cell division protein FtsL [Thermoclostridium caenicola]HPO76575.1 cell division protein FtsL [Thermoclostridium caenicola]
METRSGYVYGSVAPKLPQRPERHETHQPKERQVRVSRVAVPRYAHIPKGRLCFCIVALVAMCFVVLYRFSLLADLNAAMNRMNEEYNTLRNENRLLKVEIETSIDLDRVKQIAETELGMHKPDRFQIVPVSVPKNDYNVVLDQQYIEEASGGRKSLLEGILDAVRAAFP